MLGVRVQVRAERKLVRVFHRSPQIRVHPRQQPRHRLQASARNNREFRDTLIGVLSHRSAFKHGITIDRIEHAYDHVIVVADLDPDSDPPKVLLIGPDAAATSSNSSPSSSPATSCSSSMPCRSGRTSTRFSRTPRSDP